VEFARRRSFPRDIWRIDDDGARLSALRAWLPVRDAAQRAGGLYLDQSGRPGGLSHRSNIHGSNEPWTIGTNVSSGCIRMRNEDVIDLYRRVKVGTKVVVI
jgi:hypothetical protein